MSSYYSHYSVIFILKFFFHIILFFYVLLYANIYLYTPPQPTNECVAVVVIISYIYYDEKTFHKIFVGVDVLTPWYIHNVNFESNNIFAFFPYPSER